MRTSEFVRGYAMRMLKAACARGCYCRLPKWPWPRITLDSSLGCSINKTRSGARTLTRRWILGQCKCKCTLNLVTGINEMLYVWILLIPADTWRKSNVIMTSKWHCHVVLTSWLHYYCVVCLLGCWRPNILALGDQCLVCWCPGS